MSGLVRVHSGRPLFVEFSFFCVRWYTFLYVVVLGRLACLDYLGRTLEFPLDLIIHVLHRGPGAASSPISVKQLSSFCASFVNDDLFKRCETGKDQNWAVNLISSHKILVHSAIYLQLCHRIGIIKNIDPSLEPASTKLAIALRARVTHTHTHAHSTDRLG